MRKQTNPKPVNANERDPTWADENWWRWADSVPSVRPGDDALDFPYRCISAVQRASGLNEGRCAELCAVRWQKDTGKDYTGLEVDADDLPDDDVHKMIDKAIGRAFAEVWSLYCDQDVAVEVLYGDGPYAAYTAWDKHNKCYRLGVKGKFPHDTRQMVRHLFHELGHTVKNRWDSYVDTDSETLAATMRGDPTAIDRTKKAAHKLADVEDDMTAWAEARTAEWYDYITLHAHADPEPLREMVARNWEDFKTVRKLANRNLATVAPDKKAALDRQERRRLGTLERVRKLRAELARM